MNQWVKLALDLIFGAVIPIWVLNNLTERIGPTPTYLLAALIPTAWVFIDLLLITRRFNFITTYVGSSAILGGVLAFWLVDGWRYALKDTTGLIFTMLIFGGSLVLAQPFTFHLLAQTLNPDTPEKRQALRLLASEPPVRRGFVRGTLVVLLVTLASAALNFYLNLTYVTAEFGTPAFNQQVAFVNGITRIALPLPTMVAFGVAMWLGYRGLFQVLPAEEGTSPFEIEFWDLVARREAASNPAT